MSHTHTHRLTQGFKLISSFVCISSQTNRITSVYLFENFEHSASCFLFNNVSLQKQLLDIEVYGGKVPLRTNGGLEYFSPFFAVLTLVCCLQEMPRVCIQALSFCSVGSGASPGALSQRRAEGAESTSLEDVAAWTPGWALCCFLGG